MSMIVVADKHGRTDSVYHTLLQKINSKYPIVIVSWVENFVFNEELFKVKDAVIFCFCEYGWNWHIENSHIWGEKTYSIPQYSGDEWQKFENWAATNSILQFKRELLKKDVTDKVLPIEYPCLTNLYPVQTREEFNNRPINVMYYWGRSNEHRLRIQGEIWLHAYKKGFQPCDNIYLYNQYMHEERNSEKWLALWIPHWARIDINELLKVNGCAKLSLSWAGAGFKCFRTAEAPTNSVMVMWKNDYAWTHSWDETNCILVDKYDEINGIEAALKRNDLYDVYKNGVENAKKYHIDEYSRYISEIINNA